MAEAEVKQLREQLDLAKGGHEQAKTDIEQLQSRLDGLQLEHDGLQADIQAATKTDSAQESSSQETAQLKGRIRDLERLVAAVRASQPAAAASPDTMQDVSLADDRHIQPAPIARDIEKLRASMIPIQIDLTSWYDKHAGEILLL